MGTATVTVGGGGISQDAEMTNEGIGSGFPVRGTFLGLLAALAADFS